MAAQYAGWKISVRQYFAMGSGPMRAAAQIESLLQQHGGETADCAVGVLETAKLPPDEVALHLANKCGVDPARLRLLAARTASQAGTVQIVARSVETALHKLHGLGFDLGRIVSGAGVAPLPPVARDDLGGIGRTNDAVLYGARVTLWARGDDDSIDQLIAQVPSCSSADFGRPFGEVFAHYQHDFYRIDPQLFSPAVVRIVNLDSGHTFQAGQLRLDILANSFLA
jgi:methenyltetrahydromethanopterin cyclohydrolase